MERSRSKHAFVLKSAVGWTDKSSLQLALHWGGPMWPLGFVCLLPRGGPGTWHCCEHRGHRHAEFTEWVGGCEWQFLRDGVSVGDPGGVCGILVRCPEFSLLDFPHAFLLSHPTQPLCRPSPCPQHAPRHLRARGNSRLYPMPCGCRATGHRGQVE